MRNLNPGESIFYGRRVGGTNGMSGPLRDMIVPNKVAVIPPFPGFNLGALDVELRGPKVQNRLYRIRIVRRGSNSIRFNNFHSNSFR